MASAPAHDRRIEGDRLDGFGRSPDRDGRAIRPDLLNDASEADRINYVGALELPGVGAGEPILGNLVLASVHDDLAEQPMLVTDSVAIGRHLEAGHAFHETSGEAAEAAVPEGRIRLDSAQVVKVDPQPGQGLPGGFGQAEVV